MRTTFRLLLLSVLGFTSLAPAQNRSAATEHWVATWATSQPLEATSTLTRGGPPRAQPQQASPPQGAPAPGPQGPPPAPPGRGRGGPHQHRGASRADRTIERSGSGPARDRLGAHRRPRQGLGHCLGNRPQAYIQRPTRLHDPARSLDAERSRGPGGRAAVRPGGLPLRLERYGACLLYTSDAADDLLCVD